MASQPEHRPDEVTTAALLAGQRYDLPNIIRQRKIKTRPFKQIAPTEALRSDMAAPYFHIAKAWAAHRDALMQAYLEARASSDATALKAKVDAVAAQLVPQVTVANSRIATALAGVERWHRKQWVARIKGSTGLDVSMVSAAQDVQPDIANAQTWGQQLTLSVHQNTYAGIAAAFLFGLAALKPPQDVQADFNAVIANARRRAAGIGVDQTDKTSRALDRARRTAAGLGRFRWRHQDQKNPRPEHKARDNKVFSPGNAPNDRAGVLPFCKCWEEPLLD